MKKLFSLFFFYFTFYISSFCQKHIIELSPSIIEIPGRNFYIIKVIDARINKNDIGFVQVGAFNRKVRADLINGLASGLKEYFDKSLPEQNGQTPIVFQIVEFQISEKTTWTEIGTAEIKVEFFIEDSLGYKKLFQTHAFTTENAMDVTKGHVQRIKTILKECIINFSKSDWKETAESKLYTETNSDSTESGTTVSISTFVPEYKTIEMTYKPLKFHYDNKKYRSLRHLNNIVLSVPNDNTKRFYKKYNSNETFAYIFGYIGGALMGWPIGRALAGQKFDFPLFASGATLAGISFIFQGSANKNAKRCVESYNEVVKGKNQ